MSEDQSALLNKAHERYHAAQVLLDAGHAEFAAARAYYTMLYAAQAYLLDLERVKKFLALAQQYFGSAPKDQ